jgi:transposase
MEFVEKKKKIFIFELKSNRLAAISEAAKKQGQFVNIDHMKIPESKSVIVWLRGLKFTVAVVKQVFKNKDGSIGTRFLASNDLTLTRSQFLTIYKRRWSVEEYHESLKQNASIGKSPARTVMTQSNHIFASIYCYVKLELLKRSKKLSHCAIKAKIYLAGIQAAFEEYHAISGTPMPVFA